MDIIYYSVILGITCLANLFGTAQVARNAIESPTESNKLSMLSIGFLTIWDTFLCFANLYLALRVDYLFQLIIMPTFFTFILFSIFEIKLLIIIWRARYWNTYVTQEQIRRGILCFYFKLYSMIAVFLFLFANFILNNFFLILMSFYLVPQIVHNAIRGGRIDFNKAYMFLMVAVRAAIPLYFKGYAGNFLELRPSYWFCVIYVGLIAAQILVIYFQSVRGSKFFIPKRYLPQQYNYLCDLPEDIEAGLESNDDCVVCMNPLNYSASSMTGPETPHTRLLLNRLRPKNNQIMRTPCGHKFHVTCLVEWMAIKMECPTCRGPLPNLE